MNYSTQKPNSAIPDSELAPTVANFAGLKHFFDSADLTIQTATQTFTDSVGGVEFPVGIVTAGDNDYSRTFASGSAIDQALSAGTWVQPGTTPVVMFGMGIVNSTGFIVGSSGASNATDALRLVAVTGAGGIYDQSVGTADVYDNLTASSSVVRMIAMVVDIANNRINSYEYDGTTLTTNSANAIANATTLDTIGAVIGWNSAKSYGMGIMHMQVAPVDADMATAVAWMYEKWLAGDKLLPPNWRNR